MTLAHTIRLRAARARANVVRMVRSSGAGHLGGALSCIDIVAAIYSTMRADPANPAWPERDRFVLSAGHKCMAQYAVLADAGYFPLEVLDTYGKLGSKIPGHPDMHKLPGIEANTGALGHGLAICVGMALGLRGTRAKVFTILGDGELPEGSNWEAFAAAAFHQVDNLTAFIDVNGLQISGSTEDVMDMEPIDAKLRSFGWDVRCVDGHDVEQLIEVLAGVPFTAGKPSAVIARTVKSKGLSFAEGDVNYHYWKPKDGELAQAEAETQVEIDRLERGCHARRVA
ncbi:MAG: transketolase [Propionibacteriaceae bacterium]|jgi:transketolase|nr:transketolase [Propionibacteriaceae bacterium]